MTLLKKTTRKLGRPVLRIGEFTFEGIKKTSKIKDSGFICGVYCHLVTVKPGVTRQVPADQVRILV